MVGLPVRRSVECHCDDKFLKPQKIMQNATCNSAIWVTRVTISVSGSHNTNWDVLLLLLHRAFLQKLEKQETADDVT